VNRKFRLGRGVISIILYLSLFVWALAGRWGLAFNVWSGAGVWCRNIFAGLMGGSCTLVCSRIRSWVELYRSFSLARTMYPILGWLEGRVIRRRRRSWS